MRVCHVVNRVDDTCGPLTHARAVNAHTDWAASVLSWDAPGDVTIADATPVVTGADRDRQLVSTWLRGFDVIHTHHPRSATWARLLARDVPQVWTAGTTFDRYTPKGRAATAVLNARTDHVTYVSRTVERSASRLERRLNRPSSVVYTGTAVDLVDAAEPPPLPDGPVVAAAGRLVPAKGYVTLVKAAKDLDATVVIAGDGPRRDVLAALAGANVELWGQVDRPTALGVVSAADAFVQPSWSEGFPTAPLEAMAAGTPCVLSRIPAHTEPFPPDAAAWAPPGEPTALRDAVRTALDGGGFAERARELVRDRYTTERTAREYADLYHTLT